MFRQVNNPIAARIETDGRLHLACLRPNPFSCELLAAVGGAVLFSQPQVL